jgi:hypothetical protein
MRGLSIPGVDGMAQNGITLNLAPPSNPCNISHLTWFDSVLETGTRVAAYKHSERPYDNRTPDG